MYMVIFCSEGPSRSWMCDSWIYNYKKCTYAISAYHH